ncbi:hypothetical protein [Campylobacter showae]|uniref:hypothetical protein n=1 Tax=Campylobacter showae TaxID=204 RepID=UPI000F0887B0|nr:hypothetical protein [Campylobacter showae]
MILEILTYPNKKLFVKSLEVKVFDDELHKFLDDRTDKTVAELLSAALDTLVKTGRDSKRYEILDEKAAK